MAHLDDGKDVSLAALAPRDRLLAALSHELRTPIGGMLGMAGLLAGTELNGEQAAYVQAIRDCGEHLIGLVNNILDLAKLDSGQVEMTPGPTDLNRLMQAVTELLSPKAHDKGLEIAWGAEAPLPTVEADEGRLRQILFNLAGNAVKYTAAGGVLLSARAEPDGPNAVRVRLSVADTGPGLAPEEHARIFQPFIQARGGVATGEASTGLGLAIVSRLADAMGGEVGLTSTPGLGSTFFFEVTLPVLRRAPAAWPLEGVKVAVVSPSPVVRAAARLQVRAAGGEAAGYAGLFEAQAADEDAVVLIDERLREPRRGFGPLGGRASIILLAAEQRGRIAPSRRAGFAGYLIKPLRAVSLVERILAAIDARDGAAAARPDDERARASNRARVLLAEDNPVNAMLGRALLEREGCEVQVARSGPEALELGRRATFDLVLMDLRLPGLDGVGVTRRLRGDGLRTPIVALTADGFEEDRRVCLQAGMNDFLVKPLDPATLQGLLARLKSGAFTARPATARLAS